MTTKAIGVAAAALTLALAAADALAQEPTVEALQRQLEQRDQVVLELLDRVEALERRVGVSPASVAQPKQPGERAPAEAQEHPAQAPSEEVQLPVQAKDAGAGEPPGRVVVEAGAAERALERSLVQAGALLLAPGRLEIEPSLVYARDEDPTPIFVTRGGQTFAGQRTRSIDELTVDVSAKLGLPWDAQLELGQPYRLRSVETVTEIGFSPVGDSRRTGAGLGDLRVGVAKTLLREGRWRPDLVGRITWDTNTGQRSNDGVSLGGGFHELRGGLVAIKRQDPIAFVGSLSYEHVFEHEGIRPGAAVSSTIGGIVALSPETSLRLLLSGAHRRETVAFGNTVGGSDSTAATVTLGGSSLVAPGVLVNLSVGIGLTEDTDDVSVGLSVPVRFDTPLY